MEKRVCFLGNLVISEYLRESHNDITGEENDNKYFETLTVVNESVYKSMPEFNKSGIIHL